MASFIDNLVDHFKIKNHCIWVNTFEEQRTLTYVYDAISKFGGKNIIEWSAATGAAKINAFNHRREKMQTSGDGALFEDANPMELISRNPLSLLEAVKYSQENEDETTFFVIKELIGIESDPILQRFIRDLKESLSVNSEQYSPIIVIAPTGDIPYSLRKIFTVMDVKLPGKDTISEYVNAFWRKHEDAKRDEATKNNIVEAASGLSTIEIMRAFNLSYLKEGELRPDFIVKEKIQTIQKSGILTYKIPNKTLDDIGGHEKLKEWIQRVKRCSSKEGRDFGIKAPKGYVSVGYAGNGKTAIAEAIANYFGVPFVVLDLSKIMGGIVGESERAARQAFEVLDTIGNCVILLDEVEKMLGGVKSSNRSDGGTLARVFGVVLQHLNDNSNQFYIMTSNDISQLPPELTRSGRLDKKWFFDFPDEEDRKSIFRIHFKNAGHDLDDTLINFAAKNSNHFTGAEIQNVVNEALSLAFLNGDKEVTTDAIKQALSSIQTVFSTSSADVQHLQRYVAQNKIPSTAKAHVENTPIKKENLMDVLLGREEQPA